jgi:hypothetical protein
MSSALAHIFMSGGKVTDGARTAVGYSVSPVSMIVGEEGIIIVDTGMDAVPAEKVLADFRTSPSGIPSRSQTPPKTAPFSLANQYNRATTRKALISKFEKILIP